MNPFKIFKIRKLVKDARENPSALAGEQVREVLWGIFIIPIIVCFLVVALFFFIGYTDILGFQIGFFKFLFWVSLVVGFTIFSVIRKIIKSVGRGASIGAKKVIDTVGQESTSDEKRI